MYNLFKYCNQSPVLKKDGLRCKESQDGNEPCSIRIFKFLLSRGSADVTTPFVSAAMIELVQNLCQCYGDRGAPK